jgi:ankyrin repeat protein
VLELLLSARANIEERDWNGMTALLWAVAVAPRPIVQLLLEAGANIEARDNRHPLFRLFLPAAFFFFGYVYISLLAGELSR